MVQEIRRIQKTGGSTYTISLPKGWVRGSNLDKGDQLVMATGTDGALVVTPNSPKRSGKLVKDVEVGADTDPRTLLRQLIGIYVTGHDVIRVRSAARIPAEVRRTVQDFSRRVIGPEIIEESSNQIVVQDVADHSDLAMRKVVRRMHLMARNMLEEAIRAVRDSDAVLAGDVVSRDDEVDRLHWFVEKQHATIGRNVTFATRMQITWLEADVMLSTAKSLERIADHATRIARNADLLGSSKVDRAVISELEELGTQAISILDDSVDALFRKDSSKANDCIERSSELQERIGGFLEGTMNRRGRSAVKLAFAAESLERTCGYSSDIAETVINLAEGLP